MALSLTTSSPSNGQTGVYKNATISVVFNEALDEDTVVPGSVILKNLETKELIELEFVLSADKKTLYITPIRFLSANARFKLSLVGTNTKVLYALANASSVELAETLYVTFTTGDEIENESPTKTETELADEGEIELPSNIQVIGETSDLEILSTTPQNREFFVEPDVDRIDIEFDQEILTSSVGDIEVVISAYYDEDEEYLAYPLTSDPASNWKFQDPHDADNQPYDFRDIEGEISANGRYVTWSKTSARDFPRNSKVTVTIPTTVESTDGLTLSNDKRFTFYIKPYPYEVSIDRVKDEMSPYSLAGLIEDDVIGKTIYKNTMNAMDLTRYSYNHLKPNRTLSRYIVASTVLDMLEALKLSADMQGGQFKKLGDLVIRYDNDIGKSMPAKFMKLKEEKETLERELIGRWTQKAHYAVKGEFNPTQRINNRTRLWKQDLMYALENHIAPYKQAAGNTAGERATKVPGRADRW